MPNLVAYLNWKPILEWYVVWCGSKDANQIEKCLREIKLHAQDMIIILESIVNIIGGT